MLEALSQLPSSILDTFTTTFESSLIHVLRQGPIPRHVGFVMDGNRRFARKMNVKTGDGHYSGFRRLEKILDICMQLGVEAVSIYAFSIENFKRPKDEVDYLMELAKTKLIELCCKSEIVQQYNIRMRVLGNWKYLPSDVAEAAKSAMEMTKNNHQRILNVFFPYTSRDEIATSIRHIAQKAESGDLDPSEITEHTIDEHLFTNECPPLDILIRTSGEIRLSDFLLWQASNDCQVQFIDCFWPEISLWRLVPSLLEFQQGYAELQRRRELDDVDDEKFGTVDQDVTSLNIDQSSGASSDEAM